MASNNGRLPANVLTPIPWAQSFNAATWVVASLVQLDNVFMAAFGHHLIINAAYRDYATQVQYYAHPPSGAGTAAKPGTSNHGLGVAVDIHLTAGEYSWMLANAPRFGWVNPEWARDDNPKNGAREPWHWEKVGSNNVVPDAIDTTSTQRRVLMIVLIQAQRGYWLVGPGYEHQLDGEEWNESIALLRDAGLIGQMVFEDGSVGQRRFDLARHSISGQA